MGLFLTVLGLCVVWYAISAIGRLSKQVCRPDYRLIEQLEQELLGIEPPKRPLRITNEPGQVFPWNYAQIMHSCVEQQILYSQKTQELQQGGMHQLAEPAPH